MSIERSEAKSWYSGHPPENAYDGDLSSFYSTIDGNAVGNFLKLYLPEKSWIGTVMLTNRGDCCQDRIVGTVVMVYWTKDGSENKVSDCGTEITGKFEISNKSLVFNQSAKITA